MQRLGVVAVLDQLVGYLLRLQLRAAEDDGENLGEIVHDTLQRQVLVLRMHHIIDVVHILGTLIARAHDDGLVILQVMLGHLLHLTAHRGREHQRGVLLRQRLEDLVDGIRETHVQHLVGLVEHDGAHSLQMGEAAILQVEQASWRSHDDLHALLQRPHLRLDGRTAIDGFHMNAVHVLRKVTDVISDLQAQLPRRREHQCLRLTAARIDTLQQRNAEGGCLARSRLRQGYHVLLSFHQQRYHRLLHWHRTHKSQFLDSAPDGRIHS